MCSSCCCPQFLRLVSSLKIGTCSWTMMLLFLSKLVKRHLWSGWYPVQSQYHYLNQKAFICILDDLPAFTGMVSNKQSLQGWSLYLAYCPDELQWEDTLPTVTWDLGWGLDFPFKGTTWCPGHSENWVSSSLNLDQIFCCVKLFLETRAWEWVVNIGIHELLKDINAVCVVGLV